MENSLKISIEEKIKENQRKMAEMLASKVYDVFQFNALISETQALRANLRPHRGDEMVAEYNWNAHNSY